MMAAVYRLTTATIIDLALHSGIIRLPSPYRYACCGRGRDGEPCAKELVVMAAAEAKRQRRAAKRLVA